MSVRTPALYRPATNRRNRGLPRSAARRGRSEPAGEGSRGSGVAEPVQRRGLVAQRQVGEHRDVLDPWTGNGVGRDRLQLHRQPAQVQRLRPTPGEGERERQVCVCHAVLRVGGDLAFERDPGGVGVGSGCVAVAPQGVGLRESQAPRTPAVVERLRRELQEDALLLVVEDPEQTKVRAHVGEQAGGLRLQGRVAQGRLRAGRSPWPRNVASLISSTSGDALLRRSAASLVSRASIPSEPEQHPREPPRGRERTRIQRLGLAKVRDRLLPPAQLLLGQPRHREQLGVSGGHPSAPGHGFEGTGVFMAHRAQI